MLARPTGEYRADACLPSITAMSEPTGDQWAAILVGHQWPGSPALETIMTAAVSRRAISRAFHDYADVLRSAAMPLSDQRGDTADGIRASFRGGADHARAVAERNAAKTTALEQAHGCAAALRSALQEIADRGSGLIRAITDGDEPLKDERIAAVVAAARAEADGRAALCLQEIYGSIQTVLDACGAGVSAHEFAGG